MPPKKTLFQKIAMVAERKPSGGAASLSKKQVKKDDTTKKRKKQVVFTNRQAKELLQSYFYGAEAATAVQQAMRAHLDQVDLLKKFNVMTDYADQDLAALSMVGASGDNPGSAKADLLRLVGDSNFPPLVMVDVPMHILKPGENKEPVETFKFPVAAPNDTVGTLHNHYPDRFDQIFPWR